MVQSQSSSIPSAVFEKSYASKGPVWSSHVSLNPLLSPELKIQILVTEMFNQLSDSIIQLPGEKPSE
jgi:hypothetical protein